MNRLTPRGAHPRLVIENVHPTLDHGRHAVKRVVGTKCIVSADIYADSHGALAARIRFRPPKSRSWQTAPMRYEVDPDRWSAVLDLAAIGRWRFTLEAWADHFSTWLDGLNKKVAAGNDVGLELLEGTALIERAASLVRGHAHSKLAEFAALFADDSAAQPERVAAAQSPVLARAMNGLVDELEVTRHAREYEIVVDPERAQFAAWYEMFPRSHGPEPGKHGTFRDAAASLPRIAKLGFDVVYLPPIHPIGKTHRKGPNNSLVCVPGDVGSPWAIGNEAGGHTAVAPELGSLADFDYFVTEARKLDLEVALDYALQCSPDHPWVTEHPEWFVRRPDGSIMYAENPPKKYQDIYPLDFWCDDREGLWNSCKKIIEFWIGHGVRTFRVDNPHTKPFAFWEWLIGSIKEEHPETIFLAEAFTRPKRMWGLAKLGFTQSYTHFTWKNTSHELRQYFEELNRTGLVEYFRGNLFTNTPDILHEYLQLGGRPAFRVRLLLAATLSPLYGIYSGYELCENVPREAGSEEYLDSEKYQLKFRNWDAPGNINADIELINQIRRDNPALRTQGNLEFHPSDNENLLFYTRSTWGNDLLIVVNLDAHTTQAGTVEVPVSQFSLDAASGYVLEDVLTNERYAWRGSHNYVRLDPAERVGHLFRVVR